MLYVLVIAYYTSSGGISASPTVNVMTIQGFASKDLCTEAGRELSRTQGFSKEFRCLRTK